MAHGPTKSGSAGSGDKSVVFRKWGIRGAQFFACVGVIFLILHFAPSLFGWSKNTDRPDSKIPGRESSSQTVARRTIASGVQCAPWSFERQTCTFDSGATAGFGQRETGLGFCLDIHYGPDQPYRFQRWDPKVRGFVDITDADGPDVRVSQTRFVGNRGSEAVTVTYWLEGPNGCGSTASAPSVTHAEQTPASPPADSSFGRPLETYEEVTS